MQVIIPSYNEAKFLPETLKQVADIEEFFEIIVVNDGSTDNTKEILEEYKNNPKLQDRLIIINHEKNKGKGSALQSGFKVTKGDLIAIHDADLEYDPLDLLEMYNIIKKGRADLVIGSRFLGGKPQRVSYYLNKIANKLLTNTLNILYDCIFTDIYCCHKIFKKELLEGITIESKGFEVEGELLSKILKLHNPKVIESPTSYYGRTYKEGKKIKWYDLFKGLYWIIKIKVCI
ncbi:MAG: glycosyltransferase family 2 protein [bacterium]